MPDARVFIKYVLSSPAQMKPRAKPKAEEIVDENVATSYEIFLLKTFTID
jgi:hypothetical protein